MKKEWTRRKIIYQMKKVNSSWTHHWSTLLKMSSRIVLLSKNSSMAISGGVNLGANYKRQS